MTVINTFQKLRSRTWGERGLVLEALFMIGGDISFSQGGYDGTALEEILPVELNGGKDTIDLSRLKATLTNDGLKHPITFLEGDTDRNAALWNELPELDGCNKVTRLKADAVPLTTFPVSGNPPLISVRDAGQGRCMSITTDSLWRWNFVTVGQGGSNRHYLKFWQNSIKWLIKDASLNPVHIRINKEAFLPNEEVQARVEALGRNYQPLEGVQLRRLGLRHETQQIIDGHERCVLGFTSVQPDLLTMGFSKCHERLPCAGYRYFLQLDR